APVLSLAFEGESWVQVFAPDGSSLEKGLLDAGDRRTYDKGEVGRIVLGNTSAVKVLSAGEPVDLAPFSRADVARFTLSSAGSLAPVVAWPDRSDPPARPAGPSVINRLRPTAGAG